MTIDKVRAELMLLEDRKNAKRSSSITPNAQPVLGMSGAGEGTEGEWVNDLHTPLFQE